MFWGLSEAVDFWEQYLKITKNNDGNSDPNDQQGFTGKEEINILIFGSNDPRHLLKTMAKMYTHKGQPHLINFYLVDGCMENVARNMILLSIALENSESMSLRYKVKLFMDVYGNALMTASSYQYLVAKTKILLKAVTDDEYMMTMTPILNLGGLKYRERDGLENALNFWLPKEENIFQIQKYWTDRLRKLLGTRYDYREGQFDWDLNMVLKERGGQQICSQIMTEAFNMSRI